MSRSFPPPESVAARPWRAARPPRRILAIRLHALGDTVITLPYLSALEAHFPATELDFLTRAEVGEIPRSLVLFDHVFEIGGGRSPHRQLASALALVPRLRRRRYDVVIDLQRNRISRAVRMLLRPAAWTEFDRFSSLAAGERTRLTIEALGLGRLAALLPTYAQPAAAREAAPEEDRSAFRDAAPEAGRRCTSGLVLREPDAGLAQLYAAGWDGAAPLVVLNPAGGFPGRCWPIEHYGRFAELWLEHVAPSTQFLVLGLPFLAPKTSQLRERLHDRLLDLAGRTSPAEAFALLRHATLVLSDDSGLMHMAWVAGAPTLALFGASRAAWSQPCGGRSDWLQACRRTDGDCIAGVCLDPPPTCLADTSPELVLERAVRLLRRENSSPVRGGGSRGSRPSRPPAR